MFVRNKYGRVHEENSSPAPHMSRTDACIGSRGGTGTLEVSAFARDVRATRSPSRRFSLDAVLVLESREVVPDPVGRRNPERLADLADRRRAIVVSNRIGNVLEDLPLDWVEKEPVQRRTSRVCDRSPCS